jgi:hypothetical protein
LFPVVFHYLAYRKQIELFIQTEKNSHMKQAGFFASLSGLTIDAIGRQVREHTNF